MNLTRNAGIAAILGAVLLILAACGGDPDEAANTTTDTLAVTTPTPVSTAPPSPQAGATPAASAAVADQPPVTTMVEQDDQTVAVEAEPDNAAATTKADSEEQPEEPQVTLIADAPDDPWGKDRPEGPASTEVPTFLESDFDADGDGSYTYDDLVRAVNYLFPTYEWPVSYRVTPELLLSGFGPLPDPNAPRFQAQYEYTLLGLYHVCAWGQAWLDAFQEGDSALMEESLSQLQDVALENPVFVYIRENLAAIFDRAALGDPSLLQQYVDTSCATYEFLPPEAGTPQASSDRENHLRTALDGGSRTLAA